MKIKLKKTIANRLYFNFGLITFLVLMAFTVMFFSLNKSAREAKSNLEILFPSAEKVEMLNNIIIESKLLIKNWAYVDKQANTADKIRLKTLLDTIYPQVMRETEILSFNWTDEDEIAQFKELKIHLRDTLFRYYNQVMNSLSTFESYNDPLVVSEVSSLLDDSGEINGAIEKAQSYATKLHNIIAEQQSSSNQRMLKSFVRLKIVITIVGLTLVILAAALALLTVINIKEPLSNFKESLLKKSNGSFIAEEYDIREDEFGEMREAMETMSENIRESIREIQMGAEILGQSSQSINNSAREIADGANHQASSAEEVSASMEEMASSITQNLENAREAEKIANVVASDVQNINKAVSDTAEAMKNIAEKITVINDIAERIDLLAINAAIEAARAGEQGKGFAVVASEVRNLAESSQNAANEIDEVSKASVDTAENSNKLLEGIIPHINQTLTRVQEISSSSDEQQSGINQVNRAIQELGDIIQQNTAAAEELSSSSDELLHQSQNQIKNITFFKIEESINAEINSEEIEDQIKTLQELLEKAQAHSTQNKLIAGNHNTNNDGIEISLTEDDSENESHKKRNKKDDEYETF